MWPTRCVMGSAMTTSTLQSSPRLVLPMWRSSLDRYTERPTLTSSSRVCDTRRPCAEHKTARSSSPQCRQVAQFPRDGGLDDNVMVTVRGRERPLASLAGL